MREEGEWDTEGREPMSGYITEIAAVSNRESLPHIQDASHGCPPKRQKTLATNI